MWDQENIPERRSDEDVESIVRFLLRSGAVSVDSRISRIDVAEGEKYESQNPLIRVINADNSRDHLVVYPTATFMGPNNLWFDTACTVNPGLYERVSQFDLTPVCRYHVRLSNSITGIENVKSQKFFSGGQRLAYDHGGEDCLDEPHLYIGRQIIYQTNQEFLEMLIDLDSEPYSS